jgi:hypothetical protein
MVALLIAGTAVVTAETVKRDGGPVTNVNTATENAVVVTDHDFFTDVPGMRTAVNVELSNRTLTVLAGLKLRRPKTSACNQPATDRRCADGRDLGGTRTTLTGHRPSRAAGRDIGVRDGR